LETRIRGPSIAIMRRRIHLGIHQIKSRENTNTNTRTSSLRSPATTWRSQEKRGIQEPGGIHRAG